MSIIIEAIAEPDAPASGVRLFLDIADGEVKFKKPNGDVIEMLNIGLGDQNILINGGFDYAQAQTPGNLTTYSNTSGRTLTADNWKVTNENASVQYQRVDADGAPETGLLSRFYGKFKKITGAGKLIVSQIVSASDMAGLRGDAARFQVKLRSGSAMTVRIALLQLTSAGTIDTIPATFVSAFGANGTDPTFGTNLSLLTPETAMGGTVVGNGVDCVLATYWQEFSLLAEIPLNSKNLAVLVYSNSQLAANDEINIAEAYLSQGDSIKDWAPSPASVEQVRCQWVYCKTFNFDTGPAQNAGTAGAIKFISARIGAVGEGAIGSWRFPTTMRVAPTLTAYNPSAANAQIRDITAAADCSATSFVDTGDSGTSISCTGNLSTIVGSVLGLHIVADATL